MKPCRAKYIPFRNLRTDENIRFTGLDLTKYTGTFHKIPCANAKRNTIYQPMCSIFISGFDTNISKVKYGFGKTLCLLR
jgi:hypothetical protein